jgi:hypothetical protein
VNSTAQVQRPLARGRKAAVRGAARLSLGLGFGLAIATSALVIAAPPSLSDRLPPPATGSVTFSSDIRPIFEQHCYACHGPDKQKSDFRLDQKEAALKGGDHGPALLPGRSADSPLIRYVAGLDDDIRMPPPKSSAKPLSVIEIGLLRAWIDQGAAWPAGTNSQPIKTKLDFWVFRPAAQPLPPQLPDSSWVRNDVDRFILDRLHKEGLAPSPEADRLTLIRRLTYDLTGLPPSQAEVDAFLSDPSDNAYERLVDRLLGSPRYGERWARYWLDTVHYGETHGYDKDKPRPHAWPYRDYVIRSLNQDKPYSRFVEEQLAGDVLYPDDPDGVVALGFIAAGPWDFVGHVELPETKTDGLIARYNDRDDMVMTTMSTFQSMTVHCARCHDHKFDPITQEDYYGLQAVFAGVDRADRWFDSDPEVFHKRKQLYAERESLNARYAVVRAKALQASPRILKLVEDRRAELKQQAASLTDALAKSDKASVSRDRTKRSEVLEELTQLEQERKGLLDHLLDTPTRTELDSVESSLAHVEEQLAPLPPPQWVYAAAHQFEASGNFKPAREPRPVQVLRRGEVKQPIHPAQPGALSCLPGLPAKFHLADPQDEGSRRAALAKWITNPANLLTRRSIVNRVWQYHFGRGLIDTPNDFGHMGSLPTHPELLDWLAYWFTEHGESIKALHRLLLTSATYRQSSADHPEFARIDGDNRFLWRMNRTRLDAESLHDSILSVSGQLDLTAGGPSIEQFWFKDDHSPVYDYSRYDQASPGADRRSVYRFIVRSVPDPLMEALDCPDAALLAPKRTVTITALQALALLNDPFVLRQSESFARRIAGQGNSSSTPEATTETRGGSQGTASPAKSESEIARRSPSAPPSDFALRAQIDEACRLAFSRPAKPQEVAKLLPYAREYGLTNLCRILYNSSEFMFVD